MNFAWELYIFLNITCHKHKNPIRWNIIHIFHLLEKTYFTHKNLHLFLYFSLDLEHWFYFCYSICPLMIFLLLDDIYLLYQLAKLLLVGGISSISLHFIFTYFFLNLGMCMLMCISVCNSTHLVDITGAPMCVCLWGTQYKLRYHSSGFVDLNFWFKCLMDLKITKTD